MFCCEGKLGYGESNDRRKSSTAEISTKPNSRNRVWASLLLHIHESTEIYTCIISVLLYVIKVSAAAIDVNVFIWRICVFNVFWSEIISSEANFFGYFD